MDCNSPIQAPKFPISSRMPISTACCAMLCNWSRLCQAGVAVSRDADEMLSNAH